MTSFELDFKRFEHQPQSDQLSEIFTPSMEGTFKTLQTADIDMNPSHSMIEPIVNRNFRNTFHHQNVPNQRQHINKNASQRYQHSSTRQQYQHIKPANSINTEILVNSINPDPSKDIGHIKYHT